MLWLCLSFPVNASLESTKLLYSTSNCFYNMPILKEMSACHTCVSFIATTCT